jgi:hypothetical protein
VNQWFTNAIERSGKWKKMRQRLVQFGATERVNQCIRMRVLPWVTLLLAMGQVRINSTLLVNQWFYSERSGKWKKVR